MILYDKLKNRINDYRNKKKIEKVISKELDNLYIAYNNISSKSSLVEYLEQSTYFIAMISKYNTHPIEISKTIINYMQSNFENLVLGVSIETEIMTTTSTFEIKSKNIYDEMKKIRKLYPRNVVKRFRFFIVLPILFSPYNNINDLSGLVYFLKLTTKNHTNPIDQISMNNKNNVGIMFKIFPKFIDYLPCNDTNNYYEIYKESEDCSAFTKLLTELLTQQDVNFDILLEYGNQLFPFINDIDTFNNIFPIFQSTMMMYAKTAPPEIWYEGPVLIQSSSSKFHITMGKTLNLPIIFFTGKNRVEFFALQIPNNIPKLEFFRGCNLYTFDETLAEKYNKDMSDTIGMHITFSISVDADSIAIDMFDSYLNSLSNGSLIEKIDSNLYRTELVSLAQSSMEENNNKLFDFVCLCYKNVPIKTTFFYGEMKDNENKQITSI